MSDKIKECTCAGEGECDRCVLHFRRDHDLDCGCLDCRLVFPSVIRKLEDDNDRLRAALTSFGYHWQSCAWHLTPLVGVDCTCGLRSALAECPPGAR